MEWYTITFILCLFGAFKEFRPSESFIIKYYKGHWKNFTDTQLNQEIFPVTTYFWLVCLVLAFLLVDMVRYKPAIILCGLCGAVTYVIVLFGTTILQIQLAQIIFAIMLSTEVAYYTYIYTKVDKIRYEMVTGFTRCAFLFGRFMAGVVAQLTTSYNLLDYEQLHYLTIGACTLASISACFLPSVSQSIYFNQRSKPPFASISTIYLGDSSKDISDNKSPSVNSVASIPAPLTFGAKLRNAYYLLWSDFLKAYTNRHVVKWSLWWAFATCGYIQVVHYIQLLWNHVKDLEKLPGDYESSEETEKNDIYNGAIEATYTIMSAVMVVVIGHLRLNWSLLGEPILAIFSLIGGLLLGVLCISHNIWIMYGAYIAFGVIYHSIITIANFEVAKHLSQDSYGLIFGINTFLALLIQTILTLVVITWLQVSITTQFIIYGCYFITLGLIFVVMSIFTLVKVVRSQKPIIFCIKSSGAN
ncbi:thiamine transporter 2-like [Copidosoma floridanum]|uniref:thiamine transporter 2-like n=1 Tax=Copidosoma floridanum TaxID=29053 RepID=UPI0006C9AA55|nr:thiamine transporter 2-like [Copidosoma floridanum]